jgi:hypothetical protein
MNTMESIGLPVDSIFRARFDPERWSCLSYAGPTTVDDWIFDGRSRLDSWAPRQLEVLPAREDPDVWRIQSTTALALDQHEMRTWHDFLGDGIELLPASLHGIGYYVVNVSRIFDGEMIAVEESAVLASRPGRRYKAVTIDLTTVNVAGLFKISGAPRSELFWAMPSPSPDTQRIPEGFYLDLVWNSERGSIPIWA